MRPSSLPGVPAMTKCRRCKRTLTDPASISAGIGPYCAKMEALALEAKRAPKAAILDPFDSFRMDITMRRDKEGLPIFNIEQVHRHHSPTGMEYGYGGSGPADLALNILARFSIAVGRLDDVKLNDGSYVTAQAWNLHQQFKREFIENAPYRGITAITGERIRTWLTQNTTSRTED